MDNTPRQEVSVQEGYGVSPERRPSHRGLFTVIAVIIMLVVAGFVVHNQLYRLREIEIRAISKTPFHEVLALAGIDGNTSSLALNEEKIRRGINSHMYLSYQGMEKVGRNKLILYVLERTDTANVLYNGLQYVIGEDGMTLSCKSSIELDNGCMTVSGLSIRDIRVGSILSCHAEAQLDAYKSVVEEIDLQGIRKEIAELNFSSLDSIYLVTVDGYTVNIGNAEELQGKIGTMRAVLKELRQRGLKGGMVEATVSGVATYRPTE